MAIQLYPLGNQDYREIILDKNVYVDKTKYSTGRKEN